MRKMDAVKADELNLAAGITSVDKAVFACGSRAYLDKHKLLAWTQELLQDLACDQPDDPWNYIETRAVAARQREHAEKAAETPEVQVSILTLAACLRDALAASALDGRLQQVLADVMQEDEEQPTATEGSAEEASTERGGRPPLVEALDLQPLVDELQKLEAEQKERRAELAQLQRLQKLKREQEELEAEQEQLRLQREELAKQKHLAQLREDRRLLVEEQQQLQQQLQLRLKVSQQKQVAAPQPQDRHEALQHLAPDVAAAPPTFAPYYAKHLLPWQLPSSLPKLYSQFPRADKAAALQPQVLRSPSRQSLPKHRGPAQVPNSPGPPQNLGLLRIPRVNPGDSLLSPARSISSAAPDVSEAVSPPSAVGPGGRFVESSLQEPRQDRVPTPKLRPRGEVPLTSSASSPELACRPADGCEVQSSPQLQKSGVGAIALLAAQALAAGQPGLHRVGEKEVSASPLVSSGVGATALLAVQSLAERQPALQRNREKEVLASSPALGGVGARAPLAAQTLADGPSALRRTEEMNALVSPPVRIGVGATALLAAQTLSEGQPALQNTRENTAPSESSGFGVAGATALLAAEALAKGHPTMQRTRAKEAPLLSASASSPELFTAVRQPGATYEGIAHEEGQRAWQKSRDKEASKQRKTRERIDKQRDSEALQAWSSGTLASGEGNRATPLQGAQSLAEGPVALQKTRPEVRPHPPSSPPAAAMSPEPPRGAGRSPVNASASTASRHKAGITSRDLGDLKASFSSKASSDLEALRRDGKARLGSVELPKLHHTSASLLQEEDPLSEHRIRRELGRVLSFTKREPSPAPFLRGAALGNGSTTFKW
eukprot:TRINITY_DN54_c1_g2_i1.p1 TRINITY_DN54_c1_g2~~TRINITY_DN54_c1_g2_i1.p1  ORF type:complete len:835 (-),score=225.19 TRINITY_DN54_c1_g2_i1:107-2611(-)